MEKIEEHLLNDVRPKNKFKNDLKIQKKKKEEEEEIKERNEWGWHTEFPGCLQSSTPWPGGGYIGVQFRIIC